MGPISPIEPVSLIDPISPISPISLISPIGSIKQTHGRAIRPAVGLCFSILLRGFDDPSVVFRRRIREHLCSMCTCWHIITVKGGMSKNIILFFLNDFKLHYILMCRQRNEQFLDVGLLPYSLTQYHLCRKLYLDLHYDVRVILG